MPAHEDDKLAERKALAFDVMAAMLQQGYSISQDYAGFILNAAEEFEFSGASLLEQCEKASEIDWSNASNSCSAKYFERVNAARPQDGRANEEG